MYSKEEAKQLRERFWNQFKVSSGRKRTKAGKPGRWIMGETGIKQLKLKFHFDEQQAWVGIEIDTRNLDKRITLWEKLESLKKILEENIDFKITWELEHPITNHKTTSRIYSNIREVNIYNTNCWKMVNKFFLETMTHFEDFFIEYKDVLKYD